MRMRETWAIGSHTYTAAVTNAGGMGVIGGLGYSPSQLRAEVRLSSTRQYTTRTYITL
jgi:NAD(P)H-dependent flavin oxidoreductase YrpB (nitropropane dioxygenase family)